MKNMPVIYVAGPFRHKSKYMSGQQDCWEIQRNIMAAMGLALEVWRRGAAALCPHANTCFFQNAAKDEVWLDGDLALLGRCDAVLMTPDWERSSGARAEHMFARQSGIQVLYSIEEVEAFIEQYRKQAAA